MPLPVIPPQPDVPGSDDLAALPAGGCGRTLTTVQTISQLVKLRLHQTDLTDNTLETLPVIVILSSHSQLLTSGLYDGLALPADLAEDPLIAVCAVAELILSEEPGQHDLNYRPTDFTLTFGRSFSHCRSGNSPSPPPSGPHH